ncbi:hypothetical protein GGF50DRAFT_121353 [Schizophyllum commune]
MKHPPPTYHTPSPPAESLCPPSQTQPTPPGWPFPISITEMGWVLTAVVMAQRLDREDEQRQRDEDEDSYPFISGLDEIDDERSELSPHNSPGQDLSSLSNSDNLATHSNYPVQREYESEDDSESPELYSLPSAAGSIDLVHDNSDVQTWEVAKSDEFAEDFVDSDQSVEEYRDD